MRRSLSPTWPIDCSVEAIFAAWMRSQLVSGPKGIPFIWFWPDSHPFAIMMTHDVEEKLGAQMVDDVMQLDRAFNIPASFQIVPEERYPEKAAHLIARIRAAGFEVNLHDLNHDGRLYEDPERFKQKAQQINKYARQYETSGFRAGSMHRNQHWMNLLDLEYDMSVPNASHLEPQAGGCCTVMPYFIGDLLELPLTTTQDYAVFHILKEPSIDIWKKQISQICQYNGLASFIVHPDYIVRRRERASYRQLLEYIMKVREEQCCWITAPAAINKWWRQRRAMRLIPNGHGWEVSGEGSDRARVAFAQLHHGKLVYLLNGEFLAGEGPHDLGTSSDA